LGDMYKEFINDAPVVSIEDPFDQVWSFNLICLLFTVFKYNIIFSFSACWQ
jgi:hypothetical protein